MSGIESEWWIPEGAGKGICLVVSILPLGPSLPDERLERLHGKHCWGRQLYIAGWGYLTYLFPANPSSYFLQELQRCLKDPDWLAQLFIKHVRLEGLGPRKEGFGPG